MHLDCLSGLPYNKRVTLATLLPLNYAFFPWFHPLAGDGASPHFDWMVA
jgi:hypothetical protein